MMHAGISSVTSAFSSSKTGCCHSPLLLPVPVCHSLVCRLPAWHGGSESGCQCGRCKRRGSGLGRFPGVGNGNPLQYSCLEDSVGRGAWQATWRSLKKSDMAEQLSMHVCSVILIFQQFSCNMSSAFWTLSSMLPSTWLICPLPDPRQIYCKEQSLGFKFL